jgi:diguanylate cyclase (GGDEF)-like protein
MFHLVNALGLTSRRAGIGLRSVFVLACLVATAQVEGACLNSADKAIQRLQTLVAQDATKALALSREELDSMATLSRPPDPALTASLLAIQAQSYSALELDGAARTAALAGLKLVPDTSNPIHLALLSVFAENVYDQAGIDAAIKSVETARTAQAADSIAESCLLISEGVLQLRQNRADLAIVSLTHAYQSSVANNRLEQRMLAAAALSSLMRDMGDYTQALALNAEVIDWNTAQEAQLSLSVSRFLRGAILTETRSFTAAVDEFAKARELSVALKDEQGIAFADLRLCELQIEIGELSQSRERCTSALRIFTAAHSTDVAKQARAGLAHIDLEQGHASVALTTLNEILENDGADMVPRQVPALYKLRSRANSALGKYRAAYADLQEYLRLYVAVDEARRLRQAATLRARFATDREIERNAELKRHLKVAQDRQRDQARWTTIVVSAGALIIALLTFHLISNRRHRRQLVLLANQDGLTGLPNRRHTFELASAALANAVAAQVPLTAALIDLDHFKTINDRCGHAGGDKVLKDFARVCRDTLRSPDILGRWGGEEFLLVMPGTTLDVALVILERVRSSALGIALPAAGAGLRVALSAGLATSQFDVKSLDELIARADAALYQAKEDGRNRVRVADESFATASTASRRAMRSRGASA